MRKLVAAVAAATACAVLAGCTSSTTSGRGGSESPAKSATPTGGSPSGSGAPSGPVTLRFAVYGDAAAVASYAAVAHAYTARHRDVTIRLSSSASAQSAARSLDSEVRHGRAPDVFLAADDQVPQLVAEGWVHPVDELLEQRGFTFGDDYQRLGLQAFSADSALQCMPHDVSPLVVYYNRALLHPRRDVATVDGTPPDVAEEGWSWEQFTAAARKVARRGDKAFYLAPTLKSLVPLVRSAGADVVDDDREPTTLTLSDADSRAALEQILAVVRDPRLFPSRASLARADAFEQFAGGRLAMLVGTRALTPRLRAVPGLRFDVLPLPNLGRFKSAATMSGYCISAQSPHLEAAADFLAFASGRRGARLTASSGYFVPANLEVLHSRTFSQPGQQPSDSQVFVRSVGRSDIAPFSAAWPRLLRWTEPVVEQLFFAPAVNLDAVLPMLDEESRAILAPPSSSPPSPSTSPSQSGSSPSPSPSGSSPSPSDP